MRCLPDGTHVLLRPLKPEDAALYPEFAAHISPEDSRLRFFSAIKELSDERIHELTHLDYERAMAFIAFEETKCEMLGVVRLHLDEDRRGGEFAVIVRSAFKGHGLGWMLMQRMIEYARMIGLERVHGQVLAENTAMLHMCADAWLPYRRRPARQGHQARDAGARSSVVRRRRLVRGR